MITNVINLNTEKNLNKIKVPNIIVFIINQKVLMYFNLF